MSSDQQTENSVESKITQLEQKIVALEQALAQAISELKGISALAQSAQAQTAQPPPPPQQMDPSMLAAFAPLLQAFIQPKSSDLEKLLVQKSLEAFLTQASVSQKFLETIMEALAASFGKKSGEAIAKKIVLME